MLIPVHCRSTMRTGVVAVRHIFTSLKVIMMMVMIKTVVYDWKLKVDVEFNILMRKYAAELKNFKNFFLQTRKRKTTRL